MHFNSQKTLLRLNSALRLVLNNAQTPSVTPPDFGTDVGGSCKRA